MSGGSSEGIPATRGETSRNDGFHSVDGGSGRDVSSIFSEVQDAPVESTRSSRGGNDAVSKETWFAPIETETTLDEVSDCPGGVCPVPWATKQERPELKEDTVNHPSHYTDGGIECIEAIEASLSLEEFRGYCKGNIQKYVWRERLKGNVESLKKAAWYLDRLISTYD